MVSQRGRVRRACVAWLACAAAATALLHVPAGQAAGTVSVSGFVFRDLDNDGVKDAGEPGVPGIRVHKGAGNGLPSTTTASDGSYALTGLPAAASGYLRVEAGWLRSQCAQLSCAPGPGPDNDFETANAFLRFPMAQLSATTTNLDVGLLPDWPGSSSSAPAPVGGVVPANEVDVAARLSWSKSTCPGASYLICRVGDTYAVSGQIHNQGTSGLTGVMLALRLPGGDQLRTNNPSADIALDRSATSPSVTGIVTGAVDPVTHSVPVTLVGQIPPGGMARLQINASVVGGPGTPGCVVGAVTSACPKGEPEGAPLTLAVTHIDQAGDPDSFGPDCLAGQPIARCGTGVHDKQVEPDEVDPVGHNVDATVGAPSSYNLTTRTFVLRPAGTTVPGGTVVWRAVAFDEGPATGWTGWTLTLVLPVGSNPQVPAANALRTCAKGTTAAGFPFVRCTGKGPLSPGVASIAVDVTASAPLTAQPGDRVVALGYATPASGQAAESTGLGSPPVSPGVDVEASATDNDSAAAISVAGP
jgi:hypothetical protein